MSVASAMRRIGAVVVAVAVLAGGVTIVLSLRHHAKLQPSCRVAGGALTYTLELDQAANSTTIAAVARHLGLPDHAVTVALATALQESQLHNLAYGDRDSLGLFQQRPSQGWGSSSDILTPSYAAGAFFKALVAIDGWQAMPVTVAAQRVQRSAAPDAYAQWEPEAVAVARAVTGETAAALTCRFRLDRSKLPPPAIDASLGKELGVASLTGPFAAQPGWTVASWIVGHAQQFRVTTVSYAGQEWRASSGRWRPVKTADERVRVVQQPATT